MSEALRTEFADEDGIHICTVMPYAVDTPHFQDGGNQIGHRVHAMPPIQEPEQVAAAILDVAARPRRQRYVPRYAMLGAILHFLAPATTARLLLHALQRFHLVSSQAPTLGNLFGPSPTKGTAHGDRRPVVGRWAFAFWVAADLLCLARGWMRPRSPQWARR